MDMGRGLMNGVKNVCPNRSPLPYPEIIYASECSFDFPFLHSAVIA